MKPNIDYADFEKLDIRIGRVVAVTAPDWSNKLLRMEVDFGEEIGIKILFSGIRKWYGPEELIGKNMAFVVNMEPKKMADEESQGMLIMADTEEKPILLFLSEALQPGSVVR